jgi:hypothetical protein
VLPPKEIYVYSFACIQSHAVKYTFGIKTKGEKRQTQGILSKRQEETGSFNLYNLMSA